MRGATDPVIHRTGREAPHALPGGQRAAGDRWREEPSRSSNVGFGTGRFGTALQVGGGITGTLTRNLSVYGDVAWQQDVGNDGGFRGWSFNGGLRFTFGAVAVAVAASPRRLRRRQ